MATEYGDVRYEEEYILNSRGMKLFTCRWVPTDCEPKALIFLCHGYAMECSISMKDAGIRLAKSGFAVYGMDYEGHGKSEGLQGYVPSFDAVENKRKMRILMGESMGGAVVLLLHRKKPEFWDGAVLIAPMCKIADDMRPHPMVISVLTKLCNFIPTWKIIPTQDVVDLAFRDPEVRKEIRNNPLCYKGKPRLQTGYQLMTVSMELEQRLEEVTLPFFIVHGEADTVTDPSVSKLLYEKASSIDKSFKLYPGMWHSLSYGEFPENRDIVFTDIVAWLKEKINMGNSRIERQQKQANDQNIPKINS
ncbi:hypothetical protein K7X08_031160 [Anisodus acutangulus]|uniref:Serine aminopeptidase S33 domain-containing protein n=1 Tax=Anisodus acutangulus TaxID=402998 RepID=A0A9Q1MKV9_9SOLA|nr:hypothetical protein K7X08_031160 [Anisodus acutangulus]